MAKSKPRKFRAPAQPLVWASDIAGDNEIPALIDEALEIIEQRTVAKRRLAEIRQILGEKLGPRERARGPGWQLFWFKAAYPERLVKSFSVNYAAFRRVDTTDTGEVA